MIASWPNKLTHKTKHDEKNDKRSENYNEVSDHKLVIFSHGILEPSFFSFRPIFLAF